MELTTFILLTLYLSASLVMGLFSVTQMQYQHRMDPFRELFRGIFSFIKGFVAWPVMFPYGLIKGKYKVNNIHKVGNTSQNI